MFGVRPLEVTTKAAPFAGDVPEFIIPPPAPIPAAVSQLLMFGMSPDSVQPRKATRRSPIAATLSSQLGLFTNCG